MDYVYGLVQNCSNPFTNALELLQSCSTKPSIFCDMKKKLFTTKIILVFTQIQQLITIDILAFSD